MTWLERMILGILGLRANEKVLVWAFELANRWTADLPVIAGYHPSIGRFTKIATIHEGIAVRAAVEETSGHQIQTAINTGLALINTLSTHLRVVPGNRLEQKSS